MTTLLYTCQYADNLDDPFSAFGVEGIEEWMGGQCGGEPLFKYVHEDGRINYVWLDSDNVEIEFIAAPMPYAPGAEHSATLREIAA